MAADLSLCLLSYLLVSDGAKGVIDFTVFSGSPELWSLLWVSGAGKPLLLGGDGCMSGAAIKDTCWPRFSKPTIQRWVSLTCWVDGPLSEMIVVAMLIMDLVY